MNRTGDCTRPLNLKNCDNKAHAAVTNRQLGGEVAKWAYTDQSGFVVGRQGLDNVIELDTQARIADLEASCNRMLEVCMLPVLSLYDFAAAFPSLAHRFIFLTINYIGFPDGLKRFFLALYTNNKCYGRFGGQTMFLYLIRAGIIQGCPASGTLFVICVDAFLRMMATSLAGSVSKAFADDIGTPMRSLAHR
jgi:hypothetical protein